MELTIEEVMQQAVGAHQEGELQGAHLAVRDDNEYPPQSQLNSLLEYYQNERYIDAEKLAISIIQEFPDHPFTWKVLGAILGQTDRISEALDANQKSVALAPQDAEGHNNLGVTLQELDRLEEARLCYNRALALKFDYAEAHNNLGNILQELNRLEEAEASYIQATELAPSNVANYASALTNLGNTQKKLGKIDEAVANYRKAIAMKPKLAGAHGNLGNALKELGRLEEAEASLRQAIALKSDYAEAHSDLGLIVYSKGDTEAALASLKLASSFDPKSHVHSLFFSVLKARKVREQSEVRAGNSNNPKRNFEFPRKIFLLDKLVKDELLTYLDKKDFLDLAKKNDDPSFGNTKGSDYDLFQDQHRAIRTLKDDLTKIMMEAVKSEIYIQTSFFSIFGSGGGTARHNHVIPRDKDPILNLVHQKYSLVYYLAVGDQDCCEPGILRFYNPNENILPHDGLITIFPADRHHSSVYGGNKNRVIVGVNFYSL